MIKTIIIRAALTLLIVSALFSFANIQEKNLKLAEVNQIEGIYIFTDCKPVSAYDFLGTEKVTLTFGSGQYADVRDKLLKKIKKQYAACNAVIFYFNDGGTDRAEAIKLK